jgi:alpha-1,2-mannosyltransferase
MLLLILSLINLAILTVGWLAIQRSAAGRPIVTWWPVVMSPAAIAVTLSVASLPLLLFLSDPRPVFSDYWKAYFPAALAVLGDPSGFAPMFDRGVASFVNLPVIALLFVPFAFMGQWVGVGAFSLLGLAAVAATWLLLVRLAELREERHWLLLLLFATNGPLLNSIKEANTTHMLLPALAGALMLLRGRRDLAAGAVLGLATLIKLPLALFGAYFLLRGRWLAALGMAGVCLIGAGLSVLLFGWDIHVLWFEKSVLRYNAHFVGAFNAQSIPAFFLRLQVGTGILDSWDTVAPTAFTRIASNIAIGLIYVAVLVVFLGLWRSARTQAGPHQALDIEYLVVITLAVVASPLSWSHYYCWLLLPAAFLLNQSEVASRAQRLTGLAGIALITPAVIIVRPAYAAIAPAATLLAVSHYLYGGLAWLVFLLWSRSRLAAAPAFPSILPRRD